MGKQPICLVVGVGPGNGAAFARRFAGEGYRVALLARTLPFSKDLARSLPGARALTCDVTDPSAIESAFSSIEQELGSYSTGSSSRGSS